eukprot:GHVR01003469.1.p1 GENE.GHVR01003469.1~~GHVR01003469.1.p1  ORF type:complete len:184 (-),score=15.95 GHVR01003469.1:336-887(-)
MKLLLIITLLVVVLLLTRREPFTEAFGFSGYKKPVGTIRFDDARPDMSLYTQAEAKVSNDMMQEFIMLTNKEISKRTGLCTYIIETTAVKKYTGPKTMYECAFMVVKNNGFAFGFSVTAMFEVEGEETRLVSLRSQPLDVETPQDITPYTEGSEGKEFIDYNLVKEKAVPTSSEFESTKNKLR